MTSVAAGNDHRGSISVGRDSIGNVFVTGHGNEVRVTLIVPDQRLHGHAGTALGRHATASNPYKGLDSFYESDSALFFGRTKLITRAALLLERLSRSAAPRLLPIIGNSGSGKSSLVRAGLLPSLVRHPLPGFRNPSVLILRPGAMPLARLVEVTRRTTGAAEIDEPSLTNRDEAGSFRSLYESLKAAESPGKRYLIVVDQFEELFTECSDVSTREAFLGNISFASTQPDCLVSSILTWRSDFVGVVRDPSPYFTAVRDNRIVVGAMSRDEIVEAIEAPARALGHPWPQTLVESLTSQAEGRSGALPLLQFALTRLWHDHAVGALAESTWASALIEDFLVEAAETLYERAGQSSLQTEAAQAIVRRAFVAMIQFGEGVADTRRVAKLSEIVTEVDGDELLRKVLAPFAAPDVRLISLGEEAGQLTFELTHETLIASWGRLREWLGNVPDKTEAARIRSDLRLERRLHDAADNWQERNGGLWRPPELDVLSAYIERQRPKFSTKSRRFVDASFAAWKAEQQREQHTRRLLRRSAVALSVLTIVLSIALALTIYYWRASVATSQRIAEERNIAERALRNFTAQRLARRSEETRENTTQQALLLAAEAIRATDQDGYAIPEARAALTESLRRVTGVGLGGEGDSIRSAVFSDDERFVATVSDALVRIWDLTEPAMPRRAKALIHNESVKFVAFDKRARNLISLPLDPNHPVTPLLWPLNTEEISPRPRSLTKDNLPLTAIGISDDHSLLAMADVLNRLIILPLDDASTATPSRTLMVPAERTIAHLVFSRDNSVLMAGAVGGRVMLWNLRATNDEPVADFDSGHRIEGPLSARDIRPDLLDVNADHSLLLTGSTEWSLESRFADPNVRLWALRNLVPTREPIIINQAGGEANKAIATAFFDDQSRIIVMTASGKINVWDVAKLPRVAGVIDRPHATFNSGTYAQDAVASSDRTHLAFTDKKAATIVDLRHLEAAQVLPARRLDGFDGSVSFVRFGRTTKLVAGGIDDTARVWDLEKIDPFAPSASVAKSPYSAVSSLSLTPSGRMAVALRESTLEFWDIASPERPTLLHEMTIDLREFNDCVICQIVISPDERWASIQDAKEDQSRIIEIGATTEQRRELLVAARTWRPTEEVMFSPDSRWLFVEESSKTYAAYDLRTRGLLRRTQVSLDGSHFTPEFSPDGQWIVFRRFINEYHDPIGRDKVVGFIALTEAVANVGARVPLSGFATSIGTVQFSPDSKWIAFSGASAFPDRSEDDKRVLLMDLTNPNSPRPSELPGSEYSSTGLVFSPDGRWLLAGAGDITLGDRTVSANVWRLQRPFVAGSPHVLDDSRWNLKLASYSPDSRWLVTVSGAAAYAKLWNLDGAVVRFVTNLVGPRPRLNNHWSARFSPDSQALILWTTDDPTAYFWRLRKQKVDERGSPIPNVDQSVEEVDFTSSGRGVTVLSSGSTTMGQGGEGGRVLYLDVARFPEKDAFFEILRTDDELDSHAYREDQAILLASGTKLHLVPADLASQLARAKSAAGRNFSWDEWVKADIGEQYRPTFPELVVGADVLRTLATEPRRLQDLGRQEDATALTQRLIAWSQALQDPGACNALAWEFAVQGWAAHALELANCAVEINPSEPNYRDTRGVALALIGRHEEAIEDFEFFVRGAAGNPRYERDVPVRLQWIDNLRAGQPFNGKFE